MEKILVPTDFSDNAENALEYAIEIANTFNATIHLVHAFQYTNKMGAFPQKQDKHRLDIIKKLKALTNKYSDRLNSKAKMVHHVTLEKPIEGLKYFIKKFKIDLVIMGTKGATGIKGAIWGSIASQLIAKVNQPIIAIPNGYKDFKLNKILLSVERTNFDDNRTILPLIEIASKSKATITTFNMVLPVVAADNNEDYQTSDLLLEISYDFHQSEDTDLKESIVNYVKDNDLDMLCMIKKDRGPISNIVHNSATKKVIFDCPVPMLVLHQERK